MAGPQNTTTTREILRGHLDGIVDRMLAEGFSDQEIQEVVDDYKSRHLIADPTAQAEPSWGDLAGTAIGQGLTSLVTGPINLLRTVATNAKDPVTLARALVIDPAIAQGRKAADAYGQGRYSEAAGHGLAALLPGVGPAAAHIGEQIGTGDPDTMARGVGNAAALVGAGPAARGAARAAGAVGRGAQAAGRAGWIRAAKIPEHLAKDTPAYRATGELAAGDQAIAEAVLSADRGTLRRSNTRAVQQAALDSGRAQRNLIRNSTAEMPAADMLAALDQEIARMEAANAPAAQLTAARARRADLADRWAAEPRAVGVQPAGDVTIDPATAAIVREGQQRAYTDLVGRPPMRQAEAPAGVPGATFEAVYPRRPTATQEALNEMSAVPDVVRMGGRAGEYSPIRVQTVSKPLSASTVQAMKQAGQKKAGDGSAMGRVEADAAREWQDANIPGLAAEKARGGTLRPAARAHEKATRAVSQSSISPVQGLLGLTNPAGWAALAVMRPRPLSFLSQRAYNLGGRLDGVGAAAPAFSALGPAQAFGQTLDAEDEARRLLIERLGGR